MKRQSFIKLSTTIFGFLTYCSIVAVFLFLGSNMVAAEESHISLSPASQHIVIQPGKSLDLTFTLTNYSDPSLVHFALFKGVFDPKTQRIIYSPFEGKDPNDPIILSDDFSTPIFMQSAESYDNTVHLMVPSNTHEAEYYFAVAISASTDNNFESKDTIHLRPTLMSPLILSVTQDGTVDSDLEFSNLSLQPANTIRIFNRNLNIVDLHSSPELMLKVTNGANLSTQAQVTITETTSMLFASKTTTHPFFTLYVLAHSSKHMAIPLQNTLLGSHRVRVHLERADGAPITKTITYIVFPLFWFKIILLVLFFISIFILILYVKSKQ